MAGNGVDIIFPSAHYSCGTTGNISVRDSVEAVSSDAVLFIKLIRQGVHVGDFWNSRMKCGVEAGNLFRIREIVLGSQNACKVRGIVQGSKVRKFFD